MPNFSINYISLVEGEISPFTKTHYHYQVRHNTVQYSIATVHPLYMLQAVQLSTSHGVCETGSCIVPWSNTRILMQLWEVFKWTSLKRPSPLFFVFKFMQNQCKLNHFNGIILNYDQVVVVELFLIFIHNLPNAHYWLLPTFI